MCLSCNRFWTALQVIWSLVYVVFGAIQLVAGIFFTISVPELHLYSILFAGSWNIVIGISGGMVACISVLSRKRQEVLLYMAISILTVNCINIVLVEYLFYVVDVQKILNSYKNHVLIDYACLVTRIATGVLLGVSFVDSQLLFCSMQSTPRGKHRGKKVRGSHEQVSDIEYIIPRPKNTKGRDHTVYDAYAQSWVFEGNENNNAGCSNAHTPPYFGVLQNGGTPKKTDEKEAKPPKETVSKIKENGHVIDKPVVHVEEASDDSTSNSDRKLCYMKSFSRSQSPMVLSASSSQISLNQSPHHQPIYEYLEKLTEPAIYRSRLDTVLSNESRSQYETPQISRRSEISSPIAEKVQYASLMKELQRAIVSKKEPPSSTSTSSSPEQSNGSSNVNDKNASGSSGDDADFSKELEAALQLIQDLESPNTIDTPSDTKSPLDTFKPCGKASVIVHPPPSDSQSTSGYSSPSTTSSINSTTSFSIHNNNSTTTVISLYSTPNRTKARSVTLVRITGGDEPIPTGKEDASSSSSSTIRDKPTGWKLNSLLRRKKPNVLPKLAPELEGAIVKSESLAYLSDVELLARHQRNQELQREIEKKVFQQLGVPRMARTESNC